MGQSILEASSHRVEIPHFYQHLNFYYRIQKGQSIGQYPESDKLNPYSRALTSNGQSQYSILFYS
jgi:hypothetical protein